MNQLFQPSFIAWRFYLVLIFIALVVTGLIGRVFCLAIIDQHFLNHQGDERTLRLIKTPSFRGMMVDRNGFPLAVSTTIYSIWANPQEFSADSKLLAELGTLLEVRPHKLSTLLKSKQKKNRQFVYLKRGLSPEIANRVKILNIPGVYLQEDFRRYYPEGEVTAHLIGFTNIDDQGQEGLELAYDKWLRGEQGKKWAVKDRLGREIADVKMLQEQQAGRDMILSIDRRIQYIAYRELLAGVIQNKAQSGSVVVLDVKTGEVLAMVNNPSFNPNIRPSGKLINYRNRAVTDTFEPGSTIKPFSVATALESGKFTPNTVINTYPGWIRVDHNVVKDHESKGALTVTQILQYSSNVGVTKMILSLPPDQVWNLLHQVGFGEVTGIGFPGEQAGSLIKHHPWGNFTRATLAIGYGVSVTTLQLAHAYSVLANQGMKLPLSLLRVDTPPIGEQVMNAKRAQQMLGLLESVVSKGGTGEIAHVPGYRVAGKTGTAKIAGLHGYEQGHYVSSFVGIAPLTNPRLVIVVVIHDPKGKNYYGGLVSGPVFERIMEGTLRLLDIQPDAA